MVSAMKHPVSQAVAAAVESLAADAGGEGGAVAVACSGGPDSTALAHAAAATGAEVELVHIDHQLRPDSAADGDRVRQLADQLGANAIVAAVDVDRGAASVEAAARRARYACLDRLAAERGWRAVLLGHTASDQAETVFMRVVRGTGVAGLAAIPARRGIYRRPMLDLWRADVEDYLQRAGLVAGEDPMNRDHAIARVRVRHRWLPEIRSENPKVDEALVRLAASAREQREVLDYAVERALSEIREGPGVSARRLAGLPAAVGKSALGHLAAEAGLDSLDAVHLERSFEIARRAEGGSLRADLPGGALYREYDLLWFCASGDESHASAKNEASPAVSVRGPDGPYEVRCWRPGDRMRPHRLRGRSRKLSDLFADARVPRSRRQGALVVVRTSDDIIVWAQHVGNAYGSPVEVTLTHP